MYFSSCSLADEDAVQHLLFLETIEYTSQVPCQIHFGISGHPVLQLNAKDCAKWQSAISLRSLALDLTGNEIPIRTDLIVPLKRFLPWEWKLDSTSVPSNVCGHLGHSCLEIERVSSRT